MRPLTASRDARPAPNPPAKREPLIRLGRRNAAPATGRARLRNIAIGVAAVVLVGAGAGFSIWRSGVIGAMTQRMEQAATAASVEVGFKVAAVNVIGRNATARDQLLEAVGLRRGDPILFFDAEAARKRIEQIPMVKSASVQRQLPDTVLVEIVERVPFARWQVDGRTVLVDRDGKVLSGYDTEGFEGLKRIVGAGAAPRVGDLLDMLGGEPDLYAKVKDIVRVRDRRWDVAFDNGVIVMLPEEGVGQAWKQLAALQRDKGILGRAIVAVDMRLPEKLVVRMMHEAVPQPPVPPKKAGKNA